MGFAEANVLRAFICRLMIYNASEANMHSVAHMSNPDTCLCISLTEPPYA